MLSAGKIKKLIKKYILWIPDRLEIFRGGVRDRDSILEIGPAHSPIFPKKEGWKVEIIDWIGEEELKNSLEAQGVNTELVEHVDYIWDRKSYADSVGKTNCFDYVVASHVVEHTASLVDFLNDCAKLLKDTGEIRLAVPDKRYIFDHFRNVTDLGEVLNNHYYGAGNQTAGMVGESVLSMADRNRRFGRKYTFRYSEETALQFMDDVLNKGIYHDVHHYCFTPASFVYLIHELSLMNLIDLSISKITRTYGHEFFVFLKRGRISPEASLAERERLLKRRSRENKM